MIEVTIDETGMIIFKDGFKFYPNMEGVE